MRAFGKAVSVVEKIGPKEPQQPPLLREWRLHARLTQEQVANRIGTTKATVSRYENGRRKPTEGYKAAFAEAVGAPDVNALYSLPTAPPSLDSMLRDAPESIRRQIRAIVETLLKTGT